MEQFDVRFMIKAPIFSRQGFNIFQAHSLLEGTYYLLRELYGYAVIFSDNLFLYNRHWSIFIV